MMWGLMFSGQGTLHAQMLPWIARNEMIDRLEGELGPDWRADLEMPEKAAQNGRAQRVLTATSCAAWQQLKPLVEPPAIIAGYSVGELAAYGAAEVFDAAEALRLAGARAACMDAAAVGTETGLLAVSGAEPAALEALRGKHGLGCAICIDAGSVVFGGPRAALRQAAREAEQFGWRATVLQVALASHTRWMAGAVEPFARVLDGVPMRAPTCTLFSSSLPRGTKLTTPLMAPVP